MPRLLAALALSTTLGLAIVAPAAAQAHGPKLHVPHCDWDPAALEWSYSNPSVTGYQHGHVGHHLMVLLPLGALPTACDGLPPPTPA